MEAIFVVIGVAAVAVIIRLIAGASDRERIAEHFRRRGGAVVACTWTPFGRGWFGSKSDRIYTVRYRDRDGALHEATVKTSMFADVYSTAERVLGAAHRSGGAEGKGEVRSAAELARENEQLRAEIDRLRRS